jgi:hypothetical protein
LVISVWQEILKAALDYLAWVGEHPDLQGRKWYQKTRLLALAIPSLRRDLRTSRLRRELPMAKAKIVGDLAVRSSVSDRGGPAVSAVSWEVRVLALLAGIELLRCVRSRWTHPFGN